MPTIISNNVPSDLAPISGEFRSRSFSNNAGTCTYKLFIPSGAHLEPRPLVVMLHGCSQTADDFASGTRMNFAAEVSSCFVAFPEQNSAANSSKCWNWFRSGHQSRGRGEPSLIAGIARQVMSEHDIDPRRVYVAGLSAGGAAAAVVAHAYPDVFAAIGVHSGLPCGAAYDLPSAFAAMRGWSAAPPSQDRRIPTIVFHGDRDTTVHPRNGSQLAIGAAEGGSYDRETEYGASSTGRSFSRFIHRDDTGKEMIEEWVLHGMGHAWSGGNTAGSFTDPQGPDATKEMIRFFLEHQIAEAQITCSG